MAETIPLAQESESPAMNPPPAHTAYEPGVPATIDYPPIPVPALLREAARRFPRRAALIFRGARTSYVRFDALADACAAGLQDAGVRADDRVALVLPNIPQFPIAFYGALRAGAVVVGCNPLYTPVELAHQLIDCGAEMVIALDRFLPNLRKALALAEQEGTPCAVRRIFSVDVAPFLPLALRPLYRLRQRKEQRAMPAEKMDKRGLPAESFERLLDANRGRHYQEVERQPGDLAVLQYTGGTTGRSKGAMLTHGNLIANALQVHAWNPSGRDGEEVTLCVAPFFHIYGLTVGLNASIHSGATLVLLPRFTVEEVAKAIKRHHPTLWPGVPTMYHALSDLAERTRVDCRSLKVCISGAAPLPREVQERFEQLTGGALVEGYGLSEASPVTHCNPVHGRRIAGSIGLPYPDTEVRLDSSTLPGNEDPMLGELLIRGPQVMRGYWNRPDETAAALQDGWLRTGDIARVDADGYYYIVDRVKDMIIASGFNVYPREVEEVLFAHPAVREAVVVGVADPYRGQTVKAYIVPRDGADTAGKPTPEHGTLDVSQEMTDSIISFCRERLAPYKIPKQIEFRSELPKTIIGKVLRRALREEAQTSYVAPSAPAQ